MSEDRKPLVPTDAHESCSSNLPKIGDLSLETSRGPIFAVEVQGTTTILIEHKGAPHSIAILLYQPEDDGREGAGMFTQVEPASARTIASSLLRLADALDGGVTRQ